MQVLSEIQTKSLYDSVFEKILPGIIHKLSTPLTTIASELHIFKTTLPPDSPYWQDIAIMEKSLNENCNIIQIIQKFQDKKNQAIAHNLTIIMDNVLAVLNLYLKLNKIHIIKKFIQDIPTLTIETKKIYTILIGLLDLAIDNTASGSEMYIKIAYEQGQFIIAIHASQSHNMTIEPQNHWCYGMLQDRDTQFSYEQDISGFHYLLKIKEL